MQTEISKSKEKRLRQQNARKEQKRSKRLRVLFSILIPVLLVVLIVSIVLYVDSTRLEYGRYLHADGTIDLEGIPEAPFLDYSAMQFSRADLLPTDDEVEATIQATLQSYEALSANADLTITADSKIKIAYTSMMDGISSNSVAPDTGMDLYLGTATFGEEVDTALIGHKAGDTVQASTTYAADHSDTTLAGKTVDYTIEILGIYEVPTLTDAFVAENLSSQAATAEEYRQSIVNDKFDTNLRNAIIQYIDENLVVTYMPEPFVENLQRIYHAQNVSQMNSYNQMYYSMLQANMYDSVYAMCGFDTEEAYNASIYASAVNDTRQFLGLQSVYEQSGMTNTEAEVKAYLIANGYDEAGYTQLLQTYGSPYVSHMILRDRVIDYLCEHVQVND